jgi:4'-phosphopantetheinyl transferase EntD
VRRGLLAALLPAGFAAADAVGPDLEGPLPPLWPAEQAGLGKGAVPARLVTYHWGRALAREAMTNLGAAPAAIPRGRSQEPIWPPGLVGSITHCTGYCAAAVARTSQWASVGIDAEVVQPVHKGMIERIATPAERQWMAGWPDIRRAAVALFSAKEAVYKAWFPLTRSWLGFQDATVELGEPKAVPHGENESIGMGHLSARLRVPQHIGSVPFDVLEGRVGYGEGFVVAAVAVPAAAVPTPPIGPG